MFCAVTISSALSFAAHADNSVLNTRWIGTWHTTGEESIVLSAQTLSIGRYRYKWISNIAKAKEGCFFSYDHTLTRTDLVKGLERVRRVAANQLLPKKDRAAMAISIRTSENALNNLEPGRYKTVSTVCLPDEGGDGAFCAPQYLLDREALYETGPCANDSDNSFYLKRYLKR